MKFNDSETVKTLIDFPTEGIKKGEIGTVVMPFTIPHEAYEVEFLKDDGSGIPKAIFAILPEHLEKA